jgi:hypothetical protein
MIMDLFFNNHNLNMFIKIFYNPHQNNNHDFISMSSLLVIFHVIINYIYIIAYINHLSIISKYPCRVINLRYIPVNSTQKNNFGKTDTNKNRLILIGMHNFHNLNKHFKSNI